MVQYLITSGTGFAGGNLAGVLQAGEDKGILAIRGRFSDGCLQNRVEYDPCNRSAVSNIIKARLHDAFHLEWSVTPGSHETDPASDVQINFADTLTLSQDRSKKRAHTGHARIFLQKCLRNYQDTADHRRQSSKTGRQGAVCGIDLRAEYYIQRIYHNMG